MADLRYCYGIAFGPPVADKPPLIHCLASGIESFMKHHCSLRLVFAKRQGNKVLLGEAFENQIREVSEAELLVVVRIAYEDAAFGPIKDLSWNK